LQFWRLKVIRETESALLTGLLHPELNPRIPTMLVGVGEFDPLWARRWWNDVLELEDTLGPTTTD